MKLDIIVPHYNEPWDVLEKFFGILDLQRGVNFSDFRVIVVNDGAEYHLDDRHFSSRPYEVKQIEIEHGGVSAARNAGIDAAEAEWITFCDCDDMYTNIYSMRDLIEVLPAPGFDMMWTPFIAEDRDPKGEIYMHLRDDMNFVFVHGKLWRRQFLIDNNIRFDTDIRFSEDSEFCAIADCFLELKRTGRIDTPQPSYAWLYRQGSVTTTPGRWVESRLNLFVRHKKVNEIFRQRMPYLRYCAQIGRTIADAYHTLNRETLCDELLEMKKEVRQLYLDHKKEFQRIDSETMKEIMKISRCENVELEHPENLRDIGNFRGHIIEEISIYQWLDNLEHENEVNA